MPDDTQRFAQYLAAVLTAREGYRAGTFPEARRLADASDFILTKSDGFVVSIVCIVDAEADGSRRFSPPRDEVAAIAKACRERYAGKINGARMPCTIEIVEVRARVDEDDLARLKPLRSRMGGIVFAFAVDLAAKKCTVNSWSFVNARRRKIDRLLGEARVGADALEPAAPAALPAEVRKPLLTAAVLALLAATFFAEQWFPVTPPAGLLKPSLPTLIAFGGVSRELVQGGEWYRLLTASFLHADPFHLVLNGIALYMAGALLEPLLGRAWLLALFTIGALGGSLCSIALNAPTTVSVGASGAIVAMLAAAFVVSFRVPEGPERTQAQGQLLRVLVPALLPIAVRSGSRIDFAAHLGGALAGFASAGALVATWPRDLVRPRLTAAATAFSVVAVAAFSWSANQAHVAYKDYAVVGALIPPDKLPKTADEMVVQASSLKATYPRDPRAHAFSAMARVRASDPAGAEAELRAALAEKRVLQTAFTRELEVSLRAMLARVLVEQKRRDEAKRELQPVCDAGPGHTVPENVRELGLCP